MGGYTRTVAGVVPLVLALIGAGTPVAAGDGATRNITNTRVGQRLAAAAAPRLGAGPHQLSVWRDRGGYVVAPHGAQLARVGGQLVPVVAPRFLGGTVRRRPTAVDPPQSWSLVFSGCFSRISDTWAWLDHCARLYKLSGDAHDSRDYYALQRTATAGPNPPWVLKDAVLQAYPAPSSAVMSWIDWTPRADRSGPCQRITLALTAPLAGLATTVDRCENWDMTKAAIGGDYRLEWSGCSCTRDRELAFDISVSVPQGTSPVWYASADVHGFAF